MTDCYQTETRVARGHEWTIEWIHDTDFGAPWEEHDGHGPVSDWTSASKRPGEMVLNEDRGSRRYYDFQAAVQQAREEGWNVAPYQWPTKGAQAAAAAMADYERLRAWCNDEWHWCGVRVVMNGTEHEASLWGIESDADDYFEEVIEDLITQCLCDLNRVTYPVNEMGV